MKMGIKTVGIFSEADKYSPLLNHVDEQILIVPSPSSKSYLNQDLMLDNRLIYTNVTLDAYILNDPVVIKEQKLNKIPQWSEVNPKTHNL